MTARVRFQPENRIVEVPSGASIADAARSGDLAMGFPCAGTGTCGRCRVILADRGSVLACQTQVEDGMSVEIPVTSRPGDLEPSVVVSSGCPETCDDARYGFALDLGTSTLAAELVDLDDGQVLVRAGCANSQAAFGSEVTRRIEHAEAHGPEDLAQAIQRDMTALARSMLDAIGASQKHLQAIAVAGNTAMEHFLYRYDPSSIRQAPHVPLVPAPPSIASSKLGLSFPADPQVYAMPCIGGWVGGDITSGILATGIHQEDPLTLFVDLGTNGEIVLGNRDWMMTCAASAGPAFEGCGMVCGCGARPGAIDRTTLLANGELGWQTIRGQAPHGICGTGLISLVANLFRAGRIDRAGQLRNPENCRGEPGVVLAPAEQTADQRAIGLVQRDLDELLRAKAAVFAGIQSLLEASGVGVSDLGRLVLAGGFGNVLQSRDAIAVGLIPDLPIDRIEFAGNTSLQGARLALLDASGKEEATRIAGSALYVELIDQPNYFEAFSAAQFLPHTDLSLFPNASGSSQAERSSE